MRRVAVDEDPGSFLGSEDSPELRRDDEALALPFVMPFAVGVRGVLVLFGAVGGIMVEEEAVGMFIDAKA